MKRLLTLIGFVVAAMAFALSDRAPTVKFSGQSVTGISRQGERIRDQGFEILDQEECVSSASSGNVLEVPFNCGYLRGVYHYRFTPQGKADSHLVLVEFSLSKRESHGTTFLVQDTVEVLETAPAAE